MDSRQSDASTGDAEIDDELEEELDEEIGDEEVEITRDELIAAMQEVVSDLSAGLKGSDRDAYLDADDLAQNDWFFAGVSDQPGQYAVTMWPAEGDEDMLRIDLGTEDDVHVLAADSVQIAELTDEFIEGLSEDEYDEDEDEDEDEFEDEEDEFAEEDEDLEDEEELDEVEELDDEVDDGSISQNGHGPKR